MTATIWLLLGLYVAVGLLYVKIKDIEKKGGGEEALLDRLDERLNQVAERSDATIAGHEELLKRWESVR